MIRRMDHMVEAARAAHRAAMKAGTATERARLRSDATWWLNSARQEKDSGALVMGDREKPARLVKKVAR